MNASNFGEAERLYREVCFRDAGNAEANLRLGILAGRSGRIEEAVRLLERAHLSAPSSFEVNLHLAKGYRLAGQSGNALRSGRRAVELNPAEPRARNELGRSYMEANRPADAEPEFREAVRLHPSAIEIRLNLYGCLQRLGNAAEAIEMLQRILQESQWSIARLLQLAAELSGDGDHDGAAECARQALRLTPACVEARVMGGLALVMANRGAEAEPMLRDAMAMNSPDAQVTATLGTAMLALGYSDEADDCFRRSIAIDAVQGLAYFGLFSTRRIKTDDARLVSAAAVQLGSTKINDKQRIYLHYGLGKAKEDLGDFESAMAHFDQANEIEDRATRRGRKLSRSAYSGAIDATIELFSRELIEASGALGAPSEMPILIVGMPRSGTSLAEQILSSHPRIGGVGEQSYWRFNWRDGVDGDFTAIRENRLASLAQRYVSRLERLSPGRLRVVDKLPTNYLWLGLIHLAIPQAQIIHTRRRPIDTCLSIYGTLMPGGGEFIHSREDLVFLYGQYERIMDHWRHVLPAERFLEIDYEEMVSRSEAVSRRMVDFVGLEWDEACLQPESNTRVVTTASLWQVRQPIYTTSIEKWKNYEPWLGALRELL
jgi:tetratricopeptide (TPR) repeat protein